MIPIKTRDETHRFTQPENWLEDKLGKCGDLSVRAEPLPAVSYTSTWRPTPAELAMLNLGGAIEIRLFVLNQPAMSAYVVEPYPAVADAALLTINEDGHGFGHDEFGVSTP